MMVSPIALLTEACQYGDYYLWHGTKFDQLDAEAQEIVVSGLARAMPSYRISQYFDVKRSIFSAYDYLVLGFDNSLQVVAMLAVAWHMCSELSFLNVLTLLIGERFHRTKIIKRLWSVLFNCLVNSTKGFPEIIAFKTYNPKSFAAMSAFKLINGTRMYPEIETNTQASDLIPKVSIIADTLSPGNYFDITTGVIHSATGGVAIDFYQELPFVSKRAIYNFFLTHVSPSDRVLCCLFIETEAARDRILRAFSISPNKREYYRQVWNIN